MKPKNLLHAFLFVFSFSLISCVNNTSNTSLKLDCSSIEELMKKDQDLRQTELKSQFFHLVDSLLKINGYSEGLEDLRNINGELRDTIWAQATELDKPFTGKKKAKRDSLWKVQNEIDSLNTLLVIKQIKQFGIDSLNTIDKQCDQNSLIVFVHCPDGLKDTVRSVILKNKQGVGENRFRHISWHLDGRVAR